MKNQVFPALGVIGLAAALASTVAAQDKAPKSPDFKKEVAPVVKKYCAGCHTGEYAPEGIAFPADMTEKWAKDNAKIMKKSASEINRKKMPPKDSPQPKAAEKKAVTDWVKANIK